MEQRFRPQGKFITIEGGEGVGKSTLARNLASWLQQYGIQVCVTREPGGTEVAQRIRSIFLDPPSDEAITKRAELYLVSAARAQHVDHKLKLALNAGTWVICDRFHDSARVYQGILGGIDDAFLEQIISHSINGLEPDLTFVLDCDEPLALERLAQRDNAASADHHGNRFDQATIEHHRMIRAGFRSLISRFPGRMVLLDGNLSASSVSTRAASVLSERLAPERFSAMPGSIT